jgi:predicted methyltransferase
MWLREFFIIFGFAIAASLATSTRSVAQDFMAPPGVPAAAFPKPKRPVADIISPIWHSEKERDAVGEPSQLVRLLSIKTGMTIADIGAGSGYYVVRLAPIVGASGRIIAQDVVAEYLRACATGCTISACTMSRSPLVSRTIRGYRLIPSILRSWCTCITKSPSLTASL